MFLLLHSSLHAWHSFFSFSPPHDFMFYPLPVSGCCFPPRPLSSPFGTWRENSHLAKLIISLTMTLVYHLYDYRFVQAYTCVWQRYGKSSVTQTIMSSSCWVNGYLPWRSQAVQIMCRLRHIWNLFKYGKILAYTDCGNIDQMYLCFRCVILTCGGTGRHCERLVIQSQRKISDISSEDIWHGESRLLCRSGSCGPQVVLWFL